ncbi:UNVERIFIED_CONTAM: Cyclin-dependent protein kinase inhibitor SMR8 [Sesamum radiatum]|uniref:Cyclin-dependent protein kinase inhibitor SMR8 n=1 Tax=Sesamum radiatum TaxID=300843 RepID=A0AAW2TVU2_SESRA
MGASQKLHQMDSDKWVMSGITLRAPLKPIFTKPLERTEAEEEFFSTTPTSVESRIPSRQVCPPAPKKRKPASSSSRSTCQYRGVREFFNPPDLESIFIRRVEGA